MNVVRSIRHFFGKSKKKKVDEEKGEDEDVRKSKKKEKSSENVSLNAKDGEKNITKEQVLENRLNRNAFHGDNQFAKAYGDDPSEHNLVVDDGLEASNRIPVVTAESDDFEKKIQINSEELSEKVGLLLEQFLNSKEDENTVVLNRDEIKDSVINYIKSFRVSSNYANVEAFLNTRFEPSNLDKNESSKKIISNNSQSSLNFLLNETRSISFNLNMNCGAESMLSVLNAIQLEFMRIKPKDTSDSLEKISKNKELAELSNHTKSESQFKTNDLSKTSIESSKGALLSDHDHLNTMFEFLHEKINTLMVNEKDAIFNLGKLSLDMQQFCYLIDLLRQWSFHKLDKLAASIEQLQNYVSGAVYAPNVTTTCPPRRRINIILVRKVDPSHL